MYVTEHIDRLMDTRPMLWEGEAYLDKPFTAVSLLEAVSLLLDGTVNPRTKGRRRDEVPAFRDVELAAAFFLRLARCCCARHTERDR